ncbi:MAG TPA: tetratricopeptide repeat protein, partial [Kofleriaceae bacterium]|nr:tetratricopeptide repeat protein [Kofleriaceae bacterium]
RQAQARAPSQPGAPPDIPDLPAPKYGGPARDLFDDLPARGPSLGDLPAPKRPSTAAAQAPAGQPSQPQAQPPGVTDLPAPKGFFDDLPRPAPDRPRDAGADLPAPKGFFDDLPQPANPARPDLPAPKGFFDDLPQAANPARPDLPAPKGFFDDLPQAANPARPDLPAPKGFFDDLPQPGYAASGVDLPVPRDFEDEQAQRSRAPRPGSDAGAGAAGPAAPPLDLGDDNLSGLDLPAPDAMPAIPATRTGVVSFRGDGAGGEADDVRGKPAGSTLGELDLAQPARRESTSQHTALQKPEPAPRPSRRKLKKIAAIAGLALALAGSGGYLVYDRWQAKKARAAAMERSLRDAHRAMLADQWGRALADAKDVLSRSPKHGEALATAALAQLAGYYDQGTNKDARVKAGRSLLEQARQTSTRGPTLAKAEAIDELIEGDAKAAIERLTPLAAGDPEALLYLGWAQLAAERWDDAAATFDKAVAASPGRKLAATYGHAQALLGKGDLDDARTQFLAVIAQDADHVGAQVGAAAAMPAAQFLEEEKDLLAILHRPKIESVDPRVRAWALRLAGNDARMAGRLDAARERYRNALELVPDDVDTMVDAAALELRDGKTDEASTGIDRALAVEPENIEANLVKVDVDIRSGALESAGKRLQALRDRKPPIGAGPRAQVEMLDGQRLAKAGDADGAIAAYGKAKEILGEGDITPTIAMATLEGNLAAAADQAGKPDEAAHWRQQATTALGGLADAASKDPAKAISLGVAYLEAGGLADAEKWLRSATAARPDDVEAHFELSQVLERAGRAGEGIDELKRAFELAPARVDLGLSLARAYEAAGRDADAGAAYAELLAGEDAPDTAAKISLEVRTRAGRFFARTGDKQHAGAEGAAILAADPNSAAGHFLVGEGLLADAKLDEARRELQRAVDAEDDPQYEDGLGRALEAIFLDKNDTAARDAALAAYQAATKRDPKLVHAWAAAGRMQMQRGDHDEAIVSFKRAYDLTPTADLAAGIGEAMNARGDKGKAVEYLEKAAHGDPPASSLWTLGQLYEAQGNRAAAAVATMSRAIDKAGKEQAAGGKRADWVPEAYFRIGQIQDSAALNNAGAACRAYKAYLGVAGPDADKAHVQQATDGIRGRHC